MTQNHARGCPDTANESIANRTSGPFTLRNSVITFQKGPAGVVARVDRADKTAYAGPFEDPETIVKRLKKVSRNGR